MKRLFWIVLVIFMSAWQFTRAEATVNLDNNPSFELNVASLSAANGAAIAQSSDAQAIGLYSAKVTPTADTGDGVYRDYTLTASEDYTFSFSIKGADGVPYQAYFYDNTAGAVLGSAVEFTGDGEWRRQVVSVTNEANTDVSVFVVKNSDDSTDPFYLDAFQLENLDHATTYGDGDQDGWIWTAGAHSSTSTRSAQSGEGGRVLDFDGADYDFTVKSALGVGMPPVELIQTPPAQGDGADHQRTVARSRTFQLVGDIVGDDRADYLRNRLRLERAVNRDRLNHDQPVPIRYRLEQNNVMIPARYVGGLEKNTAAGNSAETIGLRLNAENPFWRAAMGVANGDNGAKGIAGQGAISLTAQGTVTDANYILQRDSAGQWAAMDGGVSLITPTAVTNLTGGMARGKDGKMYAAQGVVRTWDGAVWTVIGTNTGGFATCLAISPDGGTVYVGGGFSDIDSVANTAYIAAYDIDTDTWSAMGTGANGIVSDINVSPDGDTAYVGGAFTSMGGAANTAYVAKWSVSGSSWSAMGTGANGQVLAIKPTADGGEVIAGGLFTSMAGVANTTYIAKWSVSGSSWSAMDTGANAQVQYLVEDTISEKIYATGSFTSISGITADGFAAWDRGASTWSGIICGTAPSGFEVVQAVGISPGGQFVYLGVIETVTSLGGVPVSGVAIYDTVNDRFLAMGDGVTGSSGYVIYVAYFDVSGDVWFGGTFTEMGNTSGTGYIARWTGVDWKNIAPRVRKIYQATDGKIYVAGGYINAGGEANADAISYYDPSDSSFHALGTGANGMVNAIAEAPNGDIYIGGSFTLVNSVADTVGIAYYDISAGTWNPLSTGIPGTVLSLAFAPNGDLYIGGLFPNAGDVAGTKNLAMWDGAAFNALSAEPDSAVNALVFDVSGKLFLGGAFEYIGATNVDYVAKYDPDTDTFSVLETGTNGYVNDMAIGPGGNLVLVGTFTRAGSVDANYIAAWNGSQFSNFGTGFDNVAYTVGIDGDGKIYAGGAMTTAGGVELPDKAATWTGTTWTALDVDLPGTAAIEAILVTATGIFLGFDTSGSATAAGVDTATYQGDAPGYPVFKATGPGRLYQLVNLTSGHEIYFDIDLEAGETVTLDLRPGHKTFVSSFQGPVPWAILEGSETETFQLVPGLNLISCLIDDADAEAYMLWDEYFQGFEAVVFLPIVSN